MYAPWARIVIRYGVGAMITYGLVTQEMGDTLISDPDIIIVGSALIGLFVEGWYARARRVGGST